jgi:hypothetical protein
MEEFNPKYHRKTDRPCFMGEYCNGEQVYEHIPMLMGITFENCKDFGNDYPMAACFPHYHELWAGEN